MLSDSELELLLSLDGAEYEMAPGAIVEFTVRRATINPQRPHGVSYALVLRPKSGGAPWVRFDNAHAVDQRGRGGGVLSMTTGTARRRMTAALMRSAPH